MPAYEFITDSGNVHVHICKYEDRPTSITLSDGTIAHYRISKPARMTRQWSTFHVNGVNGRYNKTFGTVIENAAHHDRLCEQRELYPMTNTRTMDEYQDRKDTEYKKEIETQKKWERITTSRDQDAAYEREFGAEDREIAKQIPDSAIKEVIHQAKTGASNDK